MNEARIGARYVQILVCGFVLVGLAGAIWMACHSPRGDALETALRPLIDQQKTDQASVAEIIWLSYLETRSNAVYWSGLYWGFTFVAATLSALAGLILKAETVVKNESLKKDLGAAFAIVAALLITISTSGDFQRKWQANRIAAAKLERTGYDFLEKGKDDPRPYLAVVAQILYERQVGIVGEKEDMKTSGEVGGGSGQPP